MLPFSLAPIDVILSLFSIPAGLKRFATPGDAKSETRFGDVYQPRFRPRHQIMHSCSQVKMKLKHPMKSRIHGMGSSSASRVRFVPKYNGSA
jgi:hypothetical protein